MHRARSLTINTSNACLVNKFNSLNSNSPNGGARPYTPPPPSCRLHKIYEEKLEVLGVLGHENWFDDNANPFYRHAEPELIHQTSGRTNNANTAAPAIVHSDDDSASDEPNKDSSTVGTVNIVIKTTPASMVRSRKPRLGDDNTQSIEFTGFESLESDSEPEEVIDSFWNGNEAEEMHSIFSKGYRDTQNDQTSNDKNEDNGEKMSPRTEREYRRLSNRNRIMDRGRLMPDTTLMMSFPLRREPRYVIGAPKVRALSPYPRRTFEF
ncbi:hypothetical protein BGX21_001694 [Mortierella sp. AD011]|nr:hypothetical protein BGX20_008020 [Mortierella sp. AD010]KAF9401435.1 hypothetical protein BGX21_001694 [Mortierella sp. AD011]